MVKTELKLIYFLSTLPIRVNVRQKHYFISILDNKYFFM